jgi:hypothetical protein
MTERCAAHLRNGDQCRSVAVKGDLCAHHRDVAADVGEETLRTGQYQQRRRQDSTLVRVVAEPDQDNVERFDDGGSPDRKEAQNIVERLARDGNGVAPSDVRPRLAAAAAANLPELERVLLDAATGATRQAWTTVTCKHCERQARYEVVIPDYRVRLDAVEKLLQQGLGRAREAQDAPTAELPTSVTDLTKLSWVDRQRFAATFCLDELEAVHRDGGEALLRERVARLSEGERRVLRSALAQAP